MKISIKELEDLGWRFDFIYWAGMENMYVKNRRNIRVGNYHKGESLPEAEYILTYSGYPTRDIESIDDLNQYEITGK